MAAPRRVENPPNPFLSEHREWLEEPPEVEVQVYEEEAASILSSNDSPDIPFRYSVNPYRGCQHACAYCYARPTHEYLGFGAGSDFDSRICVKVNAARLLVEALAKRSWRRELIAFSGVTDCYQPLEAVYRLTRGCLEACRDFRTPVGIVTKSFLVTRDIDILKALHEVARVRVYLSIPFFDDELARKVESGAPTPSRRFDAMRRLSEAGVPVGLMLAPLIPGLNDREIPAIVERAAACGAERAGVVPLRLPGSVREVFLSRLRAALPERAARVEQRIRDMRGGALSRGDFGARMSGAGDYWKAALQLFEQAAAKAGIDTTDRPESPLAAGPEAAPPGASPSPPPRAVRQLPLF